MEFKSTQSNMKKSAGRPGRTLTSSIFTDLAESYSKTAQEQMDPNQLQVGQSVYDAAGEEMIVVEDPADTTNKVLMPAAEQGQATPTVETVEDSELSTSYSVQPTTDEGGGVTMPEMAETAGCDTPKKATNIHVITLDDVGVDKQAQEDFYDEEVDWDDIRSSAIEINAYSQQKDMRGLTIAVEEITNIILSHMEMPEDAVMPAMFARLTSKCLARKAKKVEVLPEFRVAKVSKVEVLPEFKASKHALKKVSARLKKTEEFVKTAQVPETSVHPDVMSFHDVEENSTSLDTGVNSDDPEMTLGESGAVDIIECIKDMVDEGYEVVDVILSVGEKFPKDQGMKVLEDARAEGIL